MLTIDNSITLKQCLFLLVSTNILYCEIWNIEEYSKNLNTQGNSTYALERKTTTLISKGYGRKDLVDKPCKINKLYKEIQHKPIKNGSIAELSNIKELWNKKVLSLEFYGVLNKKVKIFIS